MRFCSRYLKKITTISGKLRGVEGRFHWEVVQLFEPVSQVFANFNQTLQRLELRND
ncbi:MAG: hypothetical protein R3C17_00245 [Planctomycetaceae bacterium]